MSDKEIQRLAVLQELRDHRITQVRAVDFSTFRPVKLLGYCRSLIKTVFQAWRMPVVVNRVIVAMMKP